MTLVYCLADFFNLELWPVGREAVYRDIWDGIDELVGASVSVMTSAPEELTVRLYGGWHGAVPSTRVLVRELTEAVLRDYPRRLGRCRLRLEIADAPIWDASLRLLDSTRPVPLRGHNLQFVVPTACPYQGACTISHLRTWARGGCPDGACTVRVNEVGWRYRQKMVDTLIAVDALVIDRDRRADAVIIASDDDDMIPVLLAVSVATTKTVCLRRKPVRSTYYDAILDARGVETHTW